MRVVFGFQRTMSIVLTIDGGCLQEAHCLINIALDLIVVIAVIDGR